MSEAHNNKATVARIYEAFGRGDVPAILEPLAEDIEWEFGASDHGVPWLQPRRGRDGVVAFFQTLAEGLDINDFQVHAILAEGDWVVALLRVGGTVKSTGKPMLEVCEANIWKFDDKGRVVAFRHAADTWAQRQALQA